MQNGLQNRLAISAKCWSGQRESNPHEKLGKLSLFEPIQLPGCKTGPNPAQRVQWVRNGAQSDPGPGAKKNPASVAADRGAIDRKHHGSDRKASYGDKARRATDRLRDLARDLRRGPDPYRSDPERAYAHRDSIAHQLRLIADELEAAHG